MNRNYSIDIARCLAIVMIVSCHFFIFGGFHHGMMLGGYLGGIGNFIFFAISALLFGMRYEAKGANAFVAKPFLTKRLVRLFASLWPFLIIITCWHIIGGEFSPVKAVMNFIGLCWFAKLPNVGHLWFVTMIIFCYIMYISVAKTQMISKLNGGYLCIILLIISLLMEIGVDYIGLPGYLFMVLFYSLWFFGNAGKFMHWVESLKTLWIWIGFATCSAVAMAACYNNNYLFGISVQRVACYLSGLSWLIVLLRYGKAVKPYGWLLFLSGTSYEIYLVHHILCQGELSVLYITDYEIVNYIILWSASICLGWGLKQIGDRLNKSVL